MLYLIGLGLNEKSLTKEALEIIPKCRKVYLEGYTVDFPYDFKKLEKVTGKKVEVLKREDVESERLINESKNTEIALLIYGSPLFATTHATLIKDCIDNKVKYKVLYNAGILDAIAETGLQLYKFGKISSMPEWQKNFSPDSFMDYVIENKKISSHSLILVDIGLKFKDALKQLETSLKNKKLNIDRIIVCTNMGTERKKIFYGRISELKKEKIESPYCFIIPAAMHFMEEEILKSQTGL